MPVARLTPRHADAYRTLMLDGYEREPLAFTATVAERSGLPLAWWEARLAEGADDLVVGAFDGDVLVGAAGLRVETRPAFAHKATLFGLYVAEPARRRGVGRALVMAVIDHARARPETRRVGLTLTDGNAPAQALYSACGFVPFGTEPLAVRKGTEYVSKVHMWTDLRSVSGEPSPLPR